MELPRFSMYAAVERGVCAEPSGSVSFSLPHPVQRLAGWVECRCALWVAAGFSDGGGGGGVYVNVVATCAVGDSGI